MATYNGLREPNMSQFNANLNVPVDEDMSIFSSIDFFDFDMGNEIPNLDPAETKWDPTSPAQQDFLPDYGLGELSNFGSLQGASDGFALPAIPGQRSSVTSPTSASSPVGTSAPRTGEKRKAPNDDFARKAAEEDKRRRNTAASARFRVKKKQREQTLEKTAKEMTEKAAMLETKVKQLELENQWLKGLITERDIENDVKVTKSSLDELFEKYQREERARSAGAESDES